MRAPVMIQLGKSDVDVTEDAIDQLRSDFARRHCAFLPGLLHPGLLRLLAPRLQSRNWLRREEPGIAAEEVLDDDLVQSTLQFLTNSPAFLQALRAICDRSDISFFHGRTYRLKPNAGLYDSWHDDVGDRDDLRQVGMSINLGSCAYEGGVFQLRSRDTAQPDFELANTGWGDALLFRIDLGLQHRVTAVTGSEPRIAFAGWFRSGQEDFFSALRRAASV